MFCECIWGEGGTPSPPTPQVERLNLFSKGCIFFPGPTLCMSSWKSKISEAFNQLYLVRHVYCWLENKSHSKQIQSKLLNFMAPWITQLSMHSTSKFLTFWRLKNWATYFEKSWMRQIIFPPKFWDATRSLRVCVMRFSGMFRVNLGSMVGSPSILPWTVSNHSEILWSPRKLYCWCHGKSSVPLGEYPRYIYQHIPPMYGLYNVCIGDWWLYRWLMIFPFDSRFRDLAPPPFYTSPQNWKQNRCPAVVSENPSWEKTCCPPLWCTKNPPERPSWCVVLRIFAAFQNTEISQYQSLIFKPPCFEAPLDNSCPCGNSNRWAVTLDFFTPTVSPKKPTFIKGLWNPVWSLFHGNLLGGSSHDL